MQDFFLSRVIYDQYLGRNRTVCALPLGFCFHRLDMYRAFFISENCGERMRCPYGICFNLLQLKKYSNVADSSVENLDSIFRQRNFRPRTPSLEILA